MVADLVRGGLVVVVLLCGCNRPETSASGKSSMVQQQNIDSVLSVQAPELMKIPGVVGVYRSETEEKTPIITVMVEKKDAELEKRIPKSLGGYRVVIEESGKIRPLQ